MPEKRRTYITELQQRCEYHDRQRGLRKGSALCSGNRGEGCRPDGGDRQQNDESESNSEHRSNQDTAKGQRNHATLLHGSVMNRKVRPPKNGLTICSQIECEFGETVTAPNTLPDQVA